MGWNANFAITTLVDSELKAAPIGTRAVIFDVGANSGEWAASWKPLTKKRRADVYIFEPQPHFSRSLTMLADTMNATFEQAAAWKADGTMPFSGNTASEGEGLMTSQSDASKSSISVRTVDLAAYINARFPPDGHGVLGVLKCVISCLPNLLLLLKLLY